MKTNQIMGTALIGLVIYFITKKRAGVAPGMAPPPPPYYNPNTVPQMPSSNTPQWAQWVNTITNTYGAVAWLWAPGGPFYKIPTGDIFDTVNPNILSQYQWDNPNNLPPGGYA